MFKDELDTYNKIQNRIDELEEEIFALYDAQNKRINPLKRIIKVFANTKKNEDYHEVTIKLSLYDIKVLQDIRSQELNTLKQYIKDN